MMPNPNSLRVHVPLDLRPIKDLFDLDAAADDVATSTSTNSRHISASEDFDYPVETYALPPTRALPNPHKWRAADDLGTFGGGTSRSGHSKRSKGSEHLLISDRDTVERAPGPVPAISTPSSPPPWATQPMVSFPPVTHLVHP